MPDVAGVSSTPPEPVAAPPPSEAPTLSTTDQAVADRDFSAFKAARHAERFPETKKSADSSPAEPVDQAVSTETPVKAASEPAAPKEPPKPKPKTEDRFQELLADRARERERGDRLERELRELRDKVSAPKDEPKAASSPAKAETDDPEPDPGDTTKYPDGQFDRKFIKDLGAWSARQEHKAIQAKGEEQRQAEHRQTAQEEAIRAHETRVASFAERCEKASTDDPTNYARIDRRLKELAPSIDALREGKTPTFLNALADAFLESENPVGLMLYFTDHFDEIRELPKLGPEGFLKAIGRIEARLSAAASAPPPPKHVSAAPPPPPTVSKPEASKSLDDQIEDAVARKDFDALKRLRRERDQVRLGLR